MLFLGAKRRYVVLVPALILSLVFSTVTVLGDGGFIPVSHFNVYEPGQTAILCWNGQQERMYLSINIYAEQPTEGVHFVPFPSLPKVSLGDFETFERLEDVFDRTLNFYDWRDYSDGGTSGGGSGGEDDSFNIHFNTKLGQHDVTVIEIVDPDDFKGQIDALMEKVGLAIEHWPEGLEDVLVNYTNKGFSYFAVDRFPIGNKEASVEPLIYDFLSENLVFPLEISSILKGDTNLQLAVINSEDHPIDISESEGILKKKGEGILEHSDVMEIDPSLEYLLPGRCIGMLFEGEIRLSQLKGDFLIQTKPGIIWSKVGENLARYEPRDGLEPSKLLLYENRVTAKNDKIILASESNGKTIWEKSPYHFDSVFDRGQCYRKVIFDDIDKDDNGDLIIYDYYHPNTVITRVDPGNGAKIWQTKIESKESFRDSTFIHGYGDQELLIFNTRSAIFAVTFDHGFNWSIVFEEKNFESHKINVINSDQAQLLMLYDYSDQNTKVFSPWSGSFELLWKVRMRYPSTVHFGNVDLIRIEDQGMHYFLNGRNGSIVFAYPTIKSTLLSCYSDPRTPGNLYGVFLSYDVNGLNITKICFTTSVRIWSTVLGPNMGVPDMFEFYRASHLDADGDGWDEVVISIPSSIERYSDFAHSSNITTMVLDGESGSIEFNSQGRLLGVKEKDISSGPQICLNEKDHISIYDMRTWYLHNRIQKVYSGSGEVLISLKDMNNDGYTDVITKTYNKTNHHYSWYKGDTFFNGYLGSCESFIDIDSYISYNEGSIISGISGKLLYREGYRLYSKSMESFMMMHTEDYEISSGDTAQFYISVDDKNIPITSETLRLECDHGLGDFSGFHEILPGVYTFFWTAPKTYVGPVTIRAKVVLDSTVLCSSKVVIELFDKDDSGGEDIVEIEANVWLNRLNVRVNEPVIVEVNVISGYDPLLMEINIHDLNLCAMVTQPMQVSMGRYVGTYTPIRDIGLCSMLVEVIYDGQWIESGVWNIEVEPVEEENNDSEISIGYPQVYPSMVAQDKPILIFLPISDHESSDDIRVICSDGEHGGVFSNFRVLMGSLIMVEYNSPIPGMVNITLDIYLGAKFIGSASTRITILSDGGSGSMIGDELVASYSTISARTPDSLLTHVFINVTRFGSYLDIVNFIEISPMEGVVVEQGPDYEGVTLRLIVEQFVEIEDPIKILIWDEYGSSEVLEIELSSFIDDNDEDPVKTTRPTEPEDKKSGPSILIIAIVVSLCLTLFLLITGFVLYENKHNEMNRGSVEPTSRDPRS